MKRRAYMAGLLGLAFVLIAATVKADEPAKCCSDEGTTATACAGGTCAAPSGCQDACADQKSPTGEAKIQQVSATKELADKGKDKPKVLCPVSGKPVDKEMTVAYGGGKVFFCCAKCKSGFEKDTAKYAAKANYQLVATGQAKQKACPFSGHKLNPETLSKVGDVNVCFCCNKCKAKVAKATPEEQINLVFAQAAFAKGFVIKKEKKEEAI